MPTARARRRRRPPQPRRRRSRPVPGAEGALDAAPQRRRPRASPSSATTSSASLDLDRTGRAAPADDTAPRHGLTNGLAEFIAQEEMDRAEGFWWSPDGGTHRLQRGRRAAHPDLPDRPPGQGRGRASRSTATPSPAAERPRPARRRRGRATARPAWLDLGPRRGPLPRPRRTGAATARSTAQVLTARPADACALGRASTAPDARDAPDRGARRRLDQPARRPPLRSTRGELPVVAASGPASATSSCATGDGELVAR